MALPGRQYPSLSSMHSDSSGSSMDIETRQREAALRAEIRVFYSQKGIYIHKRTFEKCLKEIKNWINMSVLVGYLMQHGLVNGPDEMNMIQSPYFGGPVKLQNLLHLTEQNGGRDGYFLLYKCFCESRQENPLGHGDVVEALERYATAHPTAPDWLEQSGETAPPSTVSSHWTIGTDGESQPGGQSLNSSSRDSIDGSVTVQQRSSNNYPPAVGESQPGGQSSNAVVQRDIRDDQAMGQQNLALPAVGESQSGGQSSNAVGQRNIRDVQAMGQQNLAFPGISTPPTHVGQPQVTSQPSSTAPYQSQQQTERNTIPPPRQTSSANPHPSRHPQAPSPTSCNQPSYSQPRSSGAGISYSGGKTNYRALDSYLSSNKEGLYSQQNTSRGGASLPKETERNKDELSSNLELLSTASSSSSTYTGIRSGGFCHQPEEETSGTFTDVDDSRFQGREEYERDTPSDAARSERDRQISIVRGLVVKGSFQILCTKHEEDFDIDCVPVDLCKNKSDFMDAVSKFVCATLNSRDGDKIGVLLGGVECDETGLKCTDFKLSTDCRAVIINRFHDLLRSSLRLVSGETTEPVDINHLKDMVSIEFSTSSPSPAQAAKSCDNNTVAVVFVTPSWSLCRNTRYVCQFKNPKGVGSKPIECYQRALGETLFVKPHKLVALENTLNNSWAKHQATSRPD